MVDKSNENKIKIIDEYEKQITSNIQIINFVINTIQDFLIVINEQYKIIAVNDSFLRFIDCQDNEILGKKYEDFITDIDNDKNIKNAFLKNCSTNQKYIYKSQINIKIKKDYIIEWQGCTFNIENEKFFIAIGSDQIKNKSEFTKLKDTEAHYRLMTASIQDIIWTLDLKLNYTYISPSVEKIRGYTIEETMKMKLEETMTKESYGKVHKLYVDTFINRKKTLDLNEKTNPLILEYYCKDGSTKWMEVHMNFMKDENNKLTGIAGITRDISNKLKMESEIRRNEKRIKRIIQSIPGISIQGCDKNGIITHWNKTSEYVFDYKEEEAIGKNVIDLELPQNLKDFYSEIIESKNFNNQIINDNKYLMMVPKKNENTVLLLWDAYILTDEDENLEEVLGIGTDITEWENMKNAVQEMKSFNNRAEYLASLGSIAAAMGHEINQPLNTIQILSDGLLYWYERDKNYDKMEIISILQKISNQGKKINQIITQMQELIKYDKDLRFSKININEIFNNILNIFISQLKRANIDIKLYFDERLKEISANKIRIEQLISNLIVNAISSFDEITRKNKYIKIRTQNDLASQSIVFEIIDNGCGIPSYLNEKIFHPFFSTKDVSVNMGIGLSICHSVVTEHKGKIIVYSNSDKDGGSVFKVTLPIS